MNSIKSLHLTRPAPSLLGVCGLPLRPRQLIRTVRYVEHGELPQGAEEKDWRLLVDSTARRHEKIAKATAAAV